MLLFFYSCLAFKMPISIPCINLSTQLEIMTSNLENTTPHQTKTSNPFIFHHLHSHHLNPGHQHLMPEFWKASSRGSLLLLLLHSPQQPEESYESLNYIKPLFQMLQRLHITFRIISELLIMAYKNLHNLACTASLISCNSLLAFSHYAPTTWTFFLFFGPLILFLMKILGLAFPLPGILCAHFSP